MSDLVFNPYFNFPSTTEESMQFYQGVFGGELKIQRFSETGMDYPKEKQNLVMHARLDAEDVTIMASDGMNDDQVKVGTNISLSLSGPDDAKLKGYFEKLSDGGNVIEPMKKQFWGDVFGMVTDKFGVLWMVNVTSPENAAK